MGVKSKVFLLVYERNILPGTGTKKLGREDTIMPGLRGLQIDIAMTFNQAKTSF
jgi:hypothetical protein